MKDVYSVSLCLFSAVTYKNILDARFVTRTISIDHMPENPVRQHKIRSSRSHRRVLHTSNYTGGLLYAIMSDKLRPLKIPVRTFHVT